MAAALGALATGSSMAEVQAASEQSTQMQMQLMTLNIQQAMVEMVTSFTKTCLQGVKDAARST